jgi:hypothetical protein
MREADFGLHPLSPLLARLQERNIAVLALLCANTVLSRREKSIPRVWFGQADAL